LLDAADNQGARDVAVIAPDVVKKFFGDEDPLGEAHQKLATSFFTVIGGHQGLSVHSFFPKCG